MDSGGRELFRRPLRSHVSEAAPLTLYSLFRIYSVFHLFLVYLRSLQAIVAVSFQVHIRLRCFSFWYGMVELFLFQCFLSSRYCFRRGWFSLASLKKLWASVSEILIISCARPGKLLLCNFSHCFSLYESHASPVSTSENSISLASPSPCCLFHYLLSFRFC